MANPIKGEVELEAGDQVYTLRLSVNAIVELEDALGIGINQIAGKFSDTANMRLGDWRTMLWAALRDRHPETSMEMAGDVLTEAGVPAVVAALGQAMQLAFPTAKKEPDRPSRARKRAGTG
ncbi:hypothetical protein EMQ25_05725 [Arsenicitalea aurantiaca]|uniref:Gene transfer agent family protein n=1 Tax=Arsenicitalea aurantiaca TaxID=1783274 RepID=A0A433XF64_9HYPH|nr:GTA-gp10 family protein [Arsenicitalea aurantiaca]RUT32644.1 hypothetical protein EMQ25_05725 [Arsenicitalea aurantiaca]